MKFRLMNYSRPLLLECFNNLFGTDSSLNNGLMLSKFSTLSSPQHNSIRLDLGQLFENGTADSE